MSADPIEHPLLRPQLEPTVRRSSIPLVIGVLAIVFANVGLLAALATGYGLTDELARFAVPREELGVFGTWALAYVGIAIALFAVHLTAGVRCLRYAPSAPRWTTRYATFAIALIFVDVALTLSTFPTGHGFLHQGLYENLVIPRLGLAILSLPWPIIALVLMRQRSARQSCVAATSATARSP